MTTMNVGVTTAFFKCRCQHCDGHIEFEAGREGETGDCPHCGMETQLYVSRVKPARVQIPWRKLFLWTLVGVAAVLALIIGRVFLSEFGPELTGERLGGIFILAAGGAVLFLAILWVVFPVFVYVGMRRIERILTQIEQNTRQ